MFSGLEKGCFGNEWVKDYSFDLMKGIIKICDMTKAETKLAKQNIEAKLKASMEIEKFSEIDKTKKQRSAYFNKENARNTTT